MENNMEEVERSLGSLTVRELIRAKISIDNIKRKLEEAEKKCDEVIKM